VTHRDGTDVGWRRRQRQHRCAVGGGGTDMGWRRRHGNKVEETAAMAHTSGGVGAWGAKRGDAGGGAEGRGGVMCGE
jgi:hypothetical protein